MIENLALGVYALISDFLVESLKPTKSSKNAHSLFNIVWLKKSQPHEPQLTHYYK